MAEQRLTNQDLAEILVKKHSLEKEDAETFIKEFFLLIEEALQKDGIAKVKGFGTFKLTEVKSRESINVNTGERFEIQGHTKVSFVPDPLLREYINKPFAHFETIVLNDGITFDDIQDEENESDDAEDNIEETIPKIIIENTSDKVIETTPTDNSTEIIINEEEVVLSPPLPVIIDTPEESEEIEPEKETAEKLAKLPLQEIIARELQETNRFFNKSIDGEVPGKSEKEAIVTPSRPSKKFVVITIIAAIFVCGVAVLFTYFPNFMDNIFGYKQPVDVIAEVSEGIQAPLINPVITDTVKTAAPANEKIDSVKFDAEINPIEPDKKEPPAVAVVKTITPEKEQPGTQQENKSTEKKVEKVQPKTESQSSGVVRDSSPVRPDSTSYNIIGTKTTHIIESGETLTRVSLRFYDTKDLWPYLVMHNKGKIPNPAVVPAGLTINIPELEKK